MKLSYDMPWRRTFELYSALTWLAAAGYTCYLIFTTKLPVNVFLIIFVLTFIIGIYRTYQAFSLLVRKTRLLGQGVEIISTKELLRRTYLAPESLYVGSGFDWETKHTQRVYDIKRKDVQKLYPPKFVMNAISKLCKFNISSNSMGKGWIHGVETKHSELLVPLKHTEGHSLFVATSGWGKTRSFEMITTQVIHRKDKQCLVIVDPKGDVELREAVKRECEKAGRAEDFLLFHPAHPSESIRLDPLANWNRSTEVASRISSLLGEEENSDSFKAFGWRVLQNYTDGLVEMDQRPNLVKLKKYIEGGPDEILLKSLTNYLDTYVENWEEAAQHYIDLAKNEKLPRPSRRTPNRLVGLVEYYRDAISKIAKSQVIDGLITAYEHPREHASKMLAGLVPLLTMLCAKPLDALLSPDPNDISDTRPIMDTKKIIEGGKVLYLATDSLSDTVVANAINTIVLADITSVAGDRYNYEKIKNPVNILIDEAAAAISKPFIELMGRGRGAGINITIATQTIPDFFAATGSQDKGLQILGNINNYYCGRITDNVSKEFISEKMGECTINTVMHTKGTTAMQGDKDVTNYTSNYGERLIPTDVPRMSPDMLGELPNFEYVGVVSAGRIIKGVVPIIEHA